MSEVQLRHPVSPPQRPWSLFEITVRGRDPFTLSAPTRSKARAEAWRRYADAWNIPFRDFLLLVSVRRAGALADDGYDYVRRTYGVEVAIGDRIALTNEGASSGKTGTVVYPGASTRYLSVVFDGTDFPANVYPKSFERVEAARG
ncbi:hypothetical protein [Beijerinckia sp. L45]|uniref:hypothetical protein n=1 Tax=Beijerinckia sp. L45 TaxID=1641855 RepID=UPI00131D60A2|nr:hypothetical protein [Beijerinckia sp. L45]